VTALHRSFVATALLLCATVAQESRPDSREVLRKAVSDLDAEDFDVREKAMRAVLAAGADARSFLEAERERGSLERRLRIDEILSRLSVRDAAAPPAPTRSLTIKDADLAEACRTLAAAYGIAIRPATDADASIRVDVVVENATALMAIDRVSVAARTTFYRDVRDGAYLLRSTTETPGPVAYVDGLRVALTQATVSRSLRYGGATTSNAYLQLQIDAEPSSAVVGVLAPVALAEATDDLGRALTPTEASRPTYVSRLDASGRVGVTAMLAPPQPDAKALARARFDIKAVFPEEVGEVEIVRPVADPDVRHGDGPVKAIVDEWAERGDSISVKISIDRPQAIGEGAPQSNVFDDRVVFLMQDGRVVEPKTSGVRGGVGRTQFVAEIPTGVCASVRVTCLLRYAVRDLPVVFENVPLP
jgi:hypothetical protein